MERSEGGRHHPLPFVAGGCRRGEPAGLANEMRWRISSPTSRGRDQAWRAWPMCALR